MRIEEAGTQKMDAFLDRLPRDVLTEVFWEALEEMNYNNSNSELHCVLEAIGAQQIGETSRYKLPNVDAVINKFRGI